MNKKAFFEEKDSQCTSSRLTHIFCKELAKCRPSRHRPSNRELCGRLQDPLSRDTILEFFSTSSINNGGEKMILQEEMLEKLNLYSPEEIFSISNSNKLKNLNSYVEYKHFKMESSLLLNELLEEGVISANTA